MLRSQCRRSRFDSIDTSAHVRLKVDERLHREAPVLDNGSHLISENASHLLRRLDRTSLHHQGFIEIGFDHLVDMGLVDGA